MIMRFVISVFLFFFSVVLFSQIPNKQWANCYGGGGLDLFRAIEATADSGYILGGTSFTAGESDFYLVKTDRKGIVQWEKRYGGGGFQMGFDITIAHDGGYVIVGELQGYFPYKSDLMAMKVDRNGNVVWNKIYGGPDKDFALHVTKCKTGGYIVSGMMSVQGYEDDMNIWIMKLDESGDMLWDRVYGGSGTDYGPEMLKETEDGDLMVLGYSASQNGEVPVNKGAFDLWLFKLDPLGNVLWSKTLGGSGTDIGKDFLLLDDGGMVVLGQTNSQNGDVSALGHGGEDFWLLNLDANGNKIWDKLYGDNRLDQPKTILKTSDGNGYLLLGDTWSNDFVNNYGVSDFLTIQVDLDGTVQWMKNWGGTDGDDMLGGGVNTWDGQYAFAGVTYSGLQTSPDIDVVNNNGYGDGWVLKLGEPEFTGIDNETDIVTTLYPNPTNDGCYIQLSEKCTDCLLYIYDVTGKIIMEKPIPMGISYIHLDHLAAGVYPWKVSSKVAGIENTIGKLIVQ